jgi:hypothetical protein
MKLTNITPENFRCSIGACPAVYTDLTPAEHRCPTGECPAVLSTEGRYVIIGKRIDPEAEGLAGKVGESEAAVEIPAEILLSALGVDDLIDRANSFIGEIEDTPLASCREIEGLTSFRALRSAIKRAKGGE